MADIILSAVYDAAQRAFSKEGSGSSRFEQDFINACNRSINRINRDADMATRVSRVTNTDDTVTGLNVDYEDVLFEGITYHLMKAGQKPARGYEKQLPHVEASFELGIAGIQTDIRNDQQDTNGSDDDTYSIIGLGKLG